MVKFAVFPSPGAVVKKDLDESIEVEVEVTPGRESYSFLMVACNETIGSMTMSYDSDDRETDNKLSELEVSRKKSSAYEGRACNLFSPPTEETTIDSWPSASSSSYQDDGEAENPTHDVDELDASDEIGSAVTNYLEREIANATEDEGPDFEGIKNENVFEADASNEAQEDKFTNATEEGSKVEGIADECGFVVDTNEVPKDEIEYVGACRSVASSVKLAAMIHHRTQAINSIRGLLEHEREQGKSSRHADQSNLLVAYSRLSFRCNDFAENDVLVKMSNDVKMLNHDIAYKRQENKVLMKTVTYLKTKNGNYARQVSQFSSTVDELVVSNKENIQRISVLEEDVADKKSTIVKMSQDLESRKIDYARELENLMSSLQEVVDLNGELQAHINQVNATSGEIEEKNAELLDVVESLTKSLNDERSMNENKIDEMMNMADTEKENHAIIVRKLEETHNDILARMTAQMSELEDDVVVKKCMIDEMSMDVHKWSSTCEENVAEITELNKQLQLSNTESDMLKVTVQGLESKNTNYATELENLMSSLQEVVDLNGELQARVKEVSAANDELGEVNNANEEKNAELLDIVESLTKSLNDERSMHEREIEETNNMAETEEENNAAIVRKLEAEMSTQKKSSDANISNLVKSLDEAMVYRRDVSCQNEQIQTMMEEMKKSTTQATEDLAAAIGQLEKGIEEEFQVTTQLKNGTEKLIMKLGDDKNSQYVDEVEDLLGNVRMIQCYQLSHFQMMNELAIKNRDQVRSIQLLPATIIEGVTNMQ